MQLVIKLTLLYNIAFQILGILVPVTLAVLMSQLYSSRYAKICQTCMFFPYFMSWVVVTYFVFAFLSPDKGLANAVLAAFGKPAVNWYMEPGRWPAIRSAASRSIWRACGAAPTSRSSATCPTRCATARGSST